jgi:AbrB family looped-hinge helix DNA binding protein
LGEKLEELQEHQVVVSITKKGQATIPKKLREKYGIKNMVLIVEEPGKGILLKPLPSPEEAFGILKPYAGGKTARELLEEGRKEDYEREKRLLKTAGHPNV